LIYKVAEGFVGTDINPITNNIYTDNWIAYCLTNSDKYHMMNGGGSNSLYTLSVSKKYPNWEMSLMDFIEFQTSYHKNIILSVTDIDLKKANKKYGEHHFNENYLREYEPKVLIHSTTKNGWESIFNDSCIKSWNILKTEKQGWEDIPIGRQLGDPIDFSDYIMFSSGAISSEIVVLSKQNGKIIMNQDMEYLPGARLYFDIQKITEDGLLIRDGCHLKVKDTLPLKPYLIWVADWKSVGLESEFSTPTQFTQRANDCFNEIYGEKVITSY
jgi:hypothetical protein